MTPSLRALFFVSASLLAAIPAHAQSNEGAAQPQQPEPQPGSDDLHGAIIVQAAGLERLDLLAGTSVLSGVELQRNLDAQIGEILTKIPGVSATSFAPGVSRPVLRGFSGERVRVLTDGLGTIDASGASADHAVAINPLIADRIEILRGPAVLLYGSQAIGGAVNVVTRRIPPRMPDEAVHIDALAGIDTASDMREGGLSVDVPLSDEIAFHVDGSWNKTDDLSIPGYAATEDLRQELFANADEEEEEGHLEEAEEFREGANTRGTLPNSATETYNFGAGIAWFSGQNNFGLSFGYFDTDYGIPGLPGVGHVHAHEEEGEEDHDHDHDHEDEHEEEEGHEEGPVRIGLNQYRVDMRGALDLGDGFFDLVQTRWAYSDYRHTEFEGDETGTVFDVEGFEGRVEFVQSRRGAWQGSIGGQYSHTNFVATGEEAFVPPNTTESFAAFTLQEVDLEPIEVEFGGRYEHTSIDVETLGLSRSFDTFSGAAGASYGLLAGLRAGVNLSRAERAPSAAELFADGPHVATQQYEIGSATLDKEGSWGAEGYLRGEIGPVRMSASVYRNWFDGFIFLSETGDEDHGLPVYQFLQQDADQFGVEGEVTFPLYESAGFTLLTDLRGDYVRATLADGTPVPRIPPLSLLGGLEAQLDHFDARAEVEWYDTQDRVAPLETPTDDFAFVNLSLAWHPMEGANNVTFIAQVDNVFDTEGRRHASFTKEFVPLSGRNFKLSARASF